METRTKTLLEFLEKSEGSGKKFSSDELKAMLVSVSFDIDACKIILPKITDQTMLLSFLSSHIKYVGYEKKVQIVLSLVDLGTKSNSELLSLLADTQNSKYVIDTIADHLNLEGKKEQELLDIMSKLAYCSIICEKVIPLLKFKKTEKHQEKIWLLIEKSQFNYQIVRRVIRYILDENYVMKLLRREEFSEGLFYDDNLKEVLLTIKGSDNLAEVIASVSDNLALCKHYVSQIKSERERFELARDLDRNSVWVAVIPTLKKKEYVSLASYKVNKLDRYSAWYPLYVIAYLPHCVSEEEILKVARKYSNFAFDKNLLFGILKYINTTSNLLMLLDHEVSPKEVEMEIIKKLKLVEKSNSELWDILAQRNYDQDMCNAILPLLGLETKSDDDLLQLLVDKKKPKYLCLFVMKYIISQENRLKVFRYHEDEAYIWEASGYLDETTLEIEFITSYYRKYFLGRINNKTLVYETIAKEGYSEDLLIAANKMFKE